MKKVLLTALSVITMFITNSYAQEVDSKKSQIVAKIGMNQTSKGSSDIFTGNVTVESIYPTVSPSRNSVAYVTFEAGARSAWHVHPAGQTLVVASGTAWTQQWNGNAYEANVGDVIYCPPTIKHWHGASKNKPMTHVSIVESIDGKNVEWLEKVSDKQYNDAEKLISKK